MSSNEESEKGTEERGYLEPAEVEGHRKRPVGPSVEGEERRPKLNEDEDDDGPDVEGHRTRLGP
jgi:hypothetical protein